MTVVSGVGLVLIAFVGRPPRFGTGLAGVGFVAVVFEHHVFHGVILVHEA